MKCYHAVFARYSNIVLTAATRDMAEKFIGLPILAAAHQVGALQSSERQLQVRCPTIPRCESFGI